MENLSRPVETVAIPLAIPVPAYLGDHYVADRVVLLDRTQRGFIAEGRPRDLATGSRDPRVQEFLRRGDLPPQ